MSALLHLGSAPPKTNQFIRPTSPFDAASSSQRLALSSERLDAAPEYAEAISRGQAGECTDALMAALGNVTAMSTDNTCTITELYMSGVCAQKVPPSMAKARGDEATGSPATSVVQACSKKGTISSSEDETSNDMTLLGEGIGMKPMNDELLAKLDTIFTESARKRQ